MMFKDGHLRIRKSLSKFFNSIQRNSFPVSLSQIFVQKTALRCSLHFHLLILRKQNGKEMKISKTEEVLGGSE